MKKAGGMWILDNDLYFDRFFSVTYDRYTPEPVEEALKHVGHWRTALDGGAHYGSVTRQIRDRFKRILAFEPNRVVYECLLRNTEGFTNIELQFKALGEGPGRISVGLAPERHQFLGTDQESIFCNSGCTQVLGAGDVEMVTIDSLGIDDLDFLKLDIEGFEFAALKGAEQTIRRSWPVVLIEDNGLGQRYGLDGTECRRFLSGLGYSCVFTGPYWDFVYVRDAS